VGATASVPVSLAGVLGAFAPQPLALFAVGLGAVWAYIAGFRSAQALRAEGSAAATRTALWAVTVSSAPALLRLALFD
jgi:hypothetical protein